MQEIETAAFARGISAASLMDQAGAGIAAAISSFFPDPGTAILYLGKGNNAGDALVAARHLHAKGWQIWARLSASPEAFKTLPSQHFEALGSHLIVKSAPITCHALPPGPVIALDGLLGIGAQPGPLSAPLAALATEMNELRQTAHTTTIAMDLPSGLHPDSGQPLLDGVQADITLTIAQVKAGLLADTALQHVGRLALIPLPDLPATTGDPAELLTPALLRPLLPRRSFDTHKTQAGRVLILAGSSGMLGAAELACRGALHAGAGMVTLLVKPSLYQLLAARVPPEVMVKPITDYTTALDLPHEALVIGPGLGRNSDAEILDLITRATTPTVVDADALNALSPVSESFSPAGPRLLTPHPGEWRRLAPTLADSTLSRRQQVEAFTSSHPGVTLLLKGARTVIAHHGQPTRFNSTGHPGMATGGMGDVLSGVLGALLAQQIPAHDAAAIGAWLCGRSAEIAATQQHPNAVLPSDVARCLGRALRDLIHASY
jgi:NAD(P)H-hydrate epimerase